MRWKDNVFILLRSVYLSLISEQCLVSSLICLVSHVYCLVSVITFSLSCSKNSGSIIITFSSSFSTLSSLTFASYHITLYVKVLLYNLTSLSDSVNTKSCPNTM